MILSRIFVGTILDRVFLSSRRIVSHLSEEKLIKLIEHLLKLESIYTFDNLLKLEFSVSHLKHYWRILTD